jgi:hypothetical protein
MLMAGDMLIGHPLRALAGGLLGLSYQASPGAHC